MQAVQADHADTHSPAHHDRRSVLTAAAASLLIALPAAAKDATAEATAVKELRGKAGFQFQYPDGWVTGFVSTLPSLAHLTCGRFCRRCHHVCTLIKEMLADSTRHKYDDMQNRRNQSGALALVGDFKNFDTASVLKADLSRLRLPPDTGACRSSVMTQKVCYTARYHCPHLVTAPKCGSPCRPTCVCSWRHRREG